MFQIVFKHHFLQKIIIIKKALQPKLAVLYNVFFNFQISAPFKYYFSNERFF